MHFDLRWPLGIFFSLSGLLLLYQGLLADPEALAKTLGVNLTLAWGVFLTVFGVSALGLAVRQARGERRS